MPGCAWADEPQAIQYSSLLRTNFIDCIDPTLDVQVNDWLRDVRRLSCTEVSLMLVANKADRQVEWCVPSEEAARFARDHGLGYIETSASNGSGVDECFEQVHDLPQGGRFNTRCP